MKAEGSPLNRVWDSSQEDARVMATAARMRRVRAAADAREEAAVPARMKNREIMVNRVGSRPLQGRKALVRMAMSRSLGESMIRQPVTPTALQPKPMAMVRHCLPQARHFWKARSMLKAARGRYPRSSSRVNRGKKMAMGGSMTETTQARTR